MPESVASNLMEAAMMNHNEPPLWITMLFESFGGAMKSVSEGGGKKKHSNEEIPPEVMAEIRKKREWRKGESS
jgi:hypothetical protein